jgi:hypothetical protein
VAVVPNLEQQSLFGATNYSFPVQDPTNTNLAVVTARLNALICPSESSSSGPAAAATALGSPVWGNTWINYAPNFGGPSPIMAWSGPITPVSNWVLERTALTTRATTSGRIAWCRSPMALPGHEYSPPVGVYTNWIPGAVNDTDESDKLRRLYCHIRQQKKAL